MPQFTATRRVKHSATDMFDLVADVEAYPGFVPLCESLVVRTRRQDGDREILVATMTVAYKFVHETFTSRVTLDRSNLQILVEYLEGDDRQCQGDRRECGRVGMQSREPSGVPADQPDRYRPCR